MPWITLPFMQGTEFHLPRQLGYQLFALEGGPPALRAQPDEVAAGRPLLPPFDVPSSHLPTLPIAELVPIQEE
jgi:hypothetical protein